MDWYYIQAKERVGPMSEEQILRLLADGVIDKSVQVWNATLPSWQPLASSSLASLLQSDSHTPPPVPGSSVGNGLVWWLAFSPIVGGICTLLLSPLVNTAGGLFWITPLLTLLLAYADDRRLNRAGYDTKLLGAAWLIPVYLWKRAGMLHQSRAYFWVWCGAMVIALLFL